MRIGHGYDAHRFAEGRKLIIGGVDIPCKVGLMGHSDADVLVHAVCDSLLGAAALRDIGYHFPDTDGEYKNIDSLILLKKVKESISQKGYSVSNIDCTVIAQMPKLSPYIEQMRDNLARVLEIQIDRINVKATTEEGMGFTGAKEGICAHAVCILEE
jgi:2-C-methyl-D-erythritol 2,4-cyclodiphosphate synthase